MNKSKILLLLVLSTLTALGAAAQSEPTLARAGAQSLRQSDIDRTIEFFEWAFQKQFTAGQRGDYRSIKIEQFKADPAGTRKGFDDLAATFAAIRTKDEDEQARVREKFNESFVEQLRRQDDAEARLLLAVYEGASTPANDDGPETPGDAVGDLSALAGEWVWSRSGSSTWGTNGSYLGSNGSRFTYKFSADGRVEFTGIMNVMAGGCNQQIFRLVRGQASLSGDSLTISWQPEKFTRDFSCDRANNYTKTRPAKTETLKIRLQTENGRRELCIEGDECYSRSK
ncbi:MAG: hypothetical protein JSS81_11170 [Acidobacteria bacterium]|nr:hypothetical protein [Acidobacteriota bacterium]